MPDLFPDLARAGEAAEPRHKIFFALRPPPDVAGTLFRLAADQRLSRGLAGRPTAPERLHISLNGLGRHAALPASLIAAAAQGADGLAWPSFVVALDRLGSWGRGEGKRPLVLWADEGVIGVRRLHEALHEQLAATGAVRGREREFNPHLTLLRDAAVVSERRVPPASWRVNEVLLLDSVHGEGRHEVLGRWRLGG